MTVVKLLTEVNKANTLFYLNGIPLQARITEVMSLPVVEIVDRNKHVLHSTGPALLKNIVGYLLPRMLEQTLDLYNYTENAEV